MALALAASASAAQAAPAPTAIVIPTQPPDWSSGALDVVGSASRIPNALRAARAAEAVALNHLRTQVLALHLEPNETVGDVCQRDPQMARRVERAIEQGARLYQAKYQPDGSVACSMSLDLGLVWSTISGNP